MSNQRFSSQFKGETIRRILELDYSASDGADRFGVSAHSLYV